MPRTAAVPTSPVRVDRWSPATRLLALERVRRTNHRPYGTISRYIAVTDDGIEREIIHGQSRRAPRGDMAVHVTIGTAPPLSCGPEGMTMHFLLKSMEMGLDGLVFGPERSGRGGDDIAAIRSIAATVTFAGSAHGAHLVCDRLADESSSDLGHMMWTGVSLGAMKGIAFAALAPRWRRTMLYSQFVVPASPYPQPPPDDRDLRRFQRAELGAMMRLSAELLAHDMRNRMFRLNQNVVRAMRPGLMYRYAQSMPTDSVSNVFTEAWRAAVVTGDAGEAATMLPTDRLATFELFDGDDAGPVSDWRERLAGVLGDSVRVVVQRGRHTDAIRISRQADRARHIRTVLEQLGRGVPIDELRHPYA